MRFIKLEKVLQDTPVSFLQRFVCGIGSFYMALSVLKDIDLRIDFLDFLRDFVSLTDYDKVPYSVIYPRGYKIVVNFGHDPKIFADQLYGILKKINWRSDITIYVPKSSIDQFVPIFKENYTKSKYYSKDLWKNSHVIFKTIKDDAKFTPAFTLLSGFDYRGIAPMLKKLAINDIKVDIEDLRDVGFDQKRKFLELSYHVDNKSVCLTSINRKIFYDHSIFVGEQTKYFVANEVDTHVVVFLGIDNKDNVVILNPSLDSPIAVDDVLIRVPKSIFIKAFTGLFACLSKS